METSGETKVVRLPPEDGFERFVSAIHGATETCPKGTVFLFDILSDLIENWYSECMVGNFFRLVCTLLWDRGVVAYFGLRRTELKSRSNAMRVAFPRQVAMYLSKKLTQASLPEIGRRFGGKHHSTVIHALQKIEKKRGQERDFDKLLENFMQSLK